MMTTDETISWLLARIGHVMDRPLTYGGTAHGVELILQNYFELLGAITHRHDDFDSAHRAVSDQQRCGAQDFAATFRTAHPDAPEIKVTEYVVEQWRSIAEHSGITIPRQLPILHSHAQSKS